MKKFTGKTIKSAHFFNIHQGYETSVEFARDMYADHDQQCCIKSQTRRPCFHFNSFFLRISRGSFNLTDPRLI
jgi:hypothetical protein